MAKETESGGSRIRIGEARPSAPRISAAARSFQEKLLHSAAILAAYSAGMNVAPHSLSAARATMLACMSAMGVLEPEESEGPDGDQ